MSIALLMACGGGSNSVPSISTQPTSVTTVVGRSAEFTVSASGRPTPTYLWRHDGEDLTSQITSTCTISGTKLTDAGEYTVVVTNTQGSATSAAATLTVKDVPNLSRPFGLAVDGSSLYVSDSLTHMVYMIDATTGAQTALAGTYNWPGSQDGTGTDATFSSPQGLALDGSGNLYVADYGNHTIRKIVIATKAVTTLAGSPGEYGTDNAAGTSARFKFPVGLAFDGTSSLYVGDSGNHAIRKIDLSNKEVSTFAGTAGTSGSSDGTPGSFSSPNGVTVDASGNVYVADYGNSTIRKITSLGAVSRLAGVTGTPGTSNGTGSDAHFYWPSGICLDASGNLLVADTYNHAIRKVTTAGAVTTLAGSIGTSGNVDTATDVTPYFNMPTGVAVNSAGLAYVTDFHNGLIRKVTSTGVVSTVIVP